MDEWHVVEHIQWRCGDDGDDCCFDHLYHHDVLYLHNCCCGCCCGCCYSYYDDDYGVGDVAHDVGCYEDIVVVVGGVVVVVGDVENDHGEFYWKIGDVVVVVVVVDDNDDADSHILGAAWVVVDRTACYSYPYP